MHIYTSMLDLDVSDSKRSKKKFLILTEIPHLKITPMYPNVNHDITI